MNLDILRWVSWLKPFRLSLIFTAVTSSALCLLLLEMAYRNYLIIKTAL